MPRAQLPHKTIALVEIRITVFSDFSCPHSYVTESGLRRIREPGLEIEYRAFELYPEPYPLPDRPLEPPEWEALKRLAEVAEIPLTEPGFVPRTTKSHEASRFAREKDCEAELRARIFDAYWIDGRDIGRIDVLTSVAEGVGLDPDELKIALDIDRYADEVAHDQDVARHLRVPGSPTLFIGTGASARVVVGARDARQLRHLIHDTARSWAQPPDDG
ncbi:MAG: hypothetical protein GEU90_00915 [Gemmatimonas sp.]|nr:hypothetical protein [Gemmatimonas sp.]